jgi:hypothetical protein
MNALPILLACLTITEVQPELAGLPSFPTSMNAWCVWSDQLVVSVENQQRVWAIASTYRLINEYTADALVIEALSYRDWWSHAADAVNPQYGLRCRREHATEAKEIYNWQIYGMPAAAPYWRLPAMAQQPYTPIVISKKKPN